MFKKLTIYVGPGPLVAAAFIGPGTVTVYSMAGVNFGYELLWALLLSMIATITLQEMAGRIGLITQRWLPHIIKTEIRPKAFAILALGLVIGAIVVGNAAYEAGNLSGAVMGLETFLPEKVISPFGVYFRPWPLLTGLFAWILLMRGSYKHIERLMIGTVMIMSVVFMITAVAGKPDLSTLIAGFVPEVRTDNILTIVALIGTTVVPYNLFLHSALVARMWNSPQSLRYVRADIFISVILGGLVSMAILVTGTLGNANHVEVVSDLSESLVPLLGPTAPYFLGVGLFSAGITSAITAPLAGGLVICGCFGWNNRLSAQPMRWTFSIILLLGVIFASLGIKPIQLIAFAQLTNGILLPVLSTFILWMANKTSLMGPFKNHLIANIFGIAIWVITLVLGCKSMLSVIQNWSL
ncbi:Nramp family divalent metal transporter [Echinicola vietnamensis]|uniref:Mn2+/Fe2_transporter, NRAMP family n=1 Tax=Echinicola vietnamensis (strain DSM 17526 / LMG 23754 / KMM 6221) TaxID=926556 RepID=L0FZ92_ECHVK|nr:Nramp family divalent metal transporter [Echinicola vietnamensis]AGA79249.1 Mn2+/Fe2_ transporter, NRAMP family [Echinicola vietnamensis DSM 17526]